MADASVKGFVRGLWWGTIPARVFLMVICAIVLSLLMPMEWLDKQSGIAPFLAYLWRGGDAQ